MYFSHYLLNAYIILNVTGFPVPIPMWVLSKLAFVVCEKGHNSVCF